MDLIWALFGSPSEASPDKLPLRGSPFRFETFAISHCIAPHYNNTSNDVNKKKSLFQKNKVVLRTHKNELNKEFCAHSDTPPRFLPPLPHSHKRRSFNRRSQV